MLSGFIVGDEKVNNSSNCVHVLNVDVNNDNLMSMEENISLNEKVEHFWNLDTLGIVNNEKSVYDINEEKIKVVDGRYEVSSPFKNYHPIIGDNYSHCVKRLKSMKGKLNKSPLLLKRYTRFFLYKQPVYKQPGLRFFENNNRMQWTFVKLNNGEQ